MKKTVQYLLLGFGAFALFVNLSFAETDKCANGKCGADKKETKCQDGKCGTDKKASKCQDSKCGGDKKKATAKEKCGQKKCG